MENTRYPRGLNVFNSFLMFSNEITQLQKLADCGRTSKEIMTDEGFNILISTFSYTK